MIVLTGRPHQTCTEHYGDCTRVHIHAYIRSFLCTCIRLFCVCVRVIDVYALIRADVHITSCLYVALMNFSFVRFFIVWVCVFFNGFCYIWMFLYCVLCKLFIVCNIICGEFKFYVEW